jgi:hypothetical protein
MVAIDWGTTFLYKLSAIRTTRMAVLCSSAGILALHPYDMLQVT